MIRKDFPLLKRLRIAVIVVMVWLSPRKETNLSTIYNFYVNNSGKATRNKKRDRTIKAKKKILQKILKQGLKLKKFFNKRLNNTFNKRLNNRLNNLVIKKKTFKHPNPKKQKKERRQRNKLNKIKID